MEVHIVRRREFAELRDAWNSGARPKCPVCEAGTANDYEAKEDFDTWVMTFAPCGHVVQADPDE